MKDLLAGATGFASKNASRLVWLAVICAVTTLVFLIRLSGTTDLESYGQPTNVAHLLDLMTRGNLIVQRDLSGDLMIFPPFHTWLMAPVAAILGLNRMAVTFPSFLAILATGLLVFEAGRRRFGELSGGLAAVALLLSPATAKQIALVAADPLFTLAVTAAALTAHATWIDAAEDKRSKLLFWFASAIATLTMGLSGILLAAAGLLSLFMNTARDRKRARAIQPNITGVALFIAFILFWLVPASLNEGFVQATTMLLPPNSTWNAGELLGPVISLLIRNLPFSLFLLFALWRQFRHPTADAGQRRFERFLATWLFVGLLIVLLSGQKGADPVFALWPAGALLAGREMARLAERMGKTKFSGVAVVISCILIGATYNAVHSVGPGNLGASVLGRELQLAHHAELAAKAMKAAGIDAHTLHHIGTPTTLQFYLGTFQPPIDKTTLAELLANANVPLDLATDGAGIETLGLTDRFPGTRRVFRWPEVESQTPVIQVFRIAR